MIKVQDRITKFPLADPEPGEIDFTAAGSVIRLSVAAEESEPVPARAGRLRRVAVFRPLSGVWPGVREADRPRPAVLLCRMRSVSPPHSRPGTVLRRSAAACSTPG